MLFPTSRKQSSSEKWLIPEVGQKVHKLSHGQCAVPESGMDRNEWLEDPEASLEGVFLAKSGPIEHQNK